MRLAILGAGSVGTAVGRRWQRSGHDVVYGARDPEAERYHDLSAEARVERISAAVQDADAVLIAIPGAGVESLLDAEGETLGGKLVFDATNRMGGDRFHQISLLEERLPNSRVYRAFNTLGWENFAEPVFDGERADLFYAGPEGDDRPTVERLIADVGLRPVYVGAGPAGADLLDGITRLWFTLALQQGHGRHLAFRTLGLAGDGSEHPR